MYDKIQEATRYLKSKNTHGAEWGIILGTGLGRLVERVTITECINYEDIPHFPQSTVETHAGKLIYGRLSEKPVIIMQGRFHLYEGYSSQQIAFPVWVMKFLGIKNLVISNAAGGINPLLSKGTIMNITDHINLLGSNPLCGPNDDRIGPRYPDMSEPYAQDLIDLVNTIALEKKIPLAKGIYVAMTGPSLETRAEYRMLKILGADAIGMSTVPEVIAAAHCGIKVLALSVITDICLPDALEPINVPEIIAIANNAEPHLVKLIEEVVLQK